jgi:ABC-type transport system involved in multi-copper enzyme maturation permease subunit
MPKLIWKEWHEQRWNLAFACVVLTALCVIGLRSRIIADYSLLIFVNSCGLLLLPVLAAAALVPAERDQGSLASLLALPIAPWKVLAVKTLVGCVICALPILLAGAVSAAITNGREMTTYDTLAQAARSALTAMFLFAWMLSLTVELPSEARAGLLSLGILVSWIIASQALARVTLHDLPVGLAFSPFGFIGTRIAVAPAYLTAAVQLLLLVPLWLWAAKRLPVPTEVKA